MLWKHRKSQSLYDWLWKCLKVTRCNCVNHIYYSFARELSIQSSGEFKTAGVSSIKLLLQQLASTWFVDSDHLESPIQMNNFKELGKTLLKRNVYFSRERIIWFLNRLYIHTYNICVYIYTYYWYSNVKCPSYLLPLGVPQEHWKIENPSDLDCIALQSQAG